MARREGDGKLCMQGGMEGKGLMSCLGLEGVS